MTPTVYTWVMLVVAGLALWTILRHSSPSLFDRFCMTSGGVILALVIGIGISLWAAGRLRLAVIAPTSGVVVCLLIYEARQLALPATSARFASKSECLVATLMAIALLLSFGRQFQYQSFWGDDGVYLTAAAHYGAGGSTTFEYDTIARSVPPASGKPSPPNGMNEAPGGGRQFHALPGWPGVMGLLGLPGKGAAVLSILFALSIGMFFFVARRLLSGDRLALLATGVLAALPLAWFGSLYPTAEMLLLAIVLATGTWIAATGSVRILLGLGVLAFGFVHISFVLIAPLVGGLLLIVGMASDDAKRRDIAVGALIVTLAGVSTALFAAHVSYKYTADINHALFHHKPWLDMAIRFTVLLGVLPWIASRGPARLTVLADNVFNSARSNIRSIALVSLTVVIAVAAVQAYRLGWTTHFIPKETSKYNSWSARAAYVAMGWKSVEHLTMVSLAGAGGVVGMVAFFLLPFQWRKRSHYSGRELIIWIASLYIIIAFGLTRADIPNNYYASRYFLPAASPVLIMLAGIWIGRVKWAKWLMVALFIPATVYISALLGQGFFLGDKQFLKDTMSRVDSDSGVYVAGSTWLKYFFEPAFLRAYGLGAGHEKTSGEPVPEVLVTDAKDVLGGVSICRTLIQRRIPWQIGYLLSPEIAEHRVCVVSPSTGGELVAPKNSWAIGGKREFLAVAPLKSTKVYVEVESEGWWASKPPYANNLAALNPVLKVCGRNFELVSLSARRIIFVGEMSAPFCHATFTSSTFRPVDYQLGQDGRALGVDMYAMKIYGERGVDP